MAHLPVAQGGSRLARGDRCLVPVHNRPERMLGHVSRCRCVPGGARGGDGGGVPDPASRGMRSDGGFHRVTRRDVPTRPRSRLLNRALRSLVSASRLKK